MTENKGNDILIGMKAIRQVLNDVGEATVLKWHRESDLPMKKKGGQWVSSRSKIERWWQDFAQ